MYPSLFLGSGLFITNPGITGICDGLILRFIAHPPGGIDGGLPSFAPFYSFELVLDFDYLPIMNRLLLNGGTIYLLLEGSGKKVDPGHEDAEEREYNEDVEAEIGPSRLAFHIGLPALHLDFVVILPGLLVEAGLLGMDSRVPLEVGCKIRHWQMGDAETVDGRGILVNFGCRTMNGYFFRVLGGVRIEGGVNTDIQILGPHRGRGEILGDCLVELPRNHHRFPPSAFFQQLRQLLSAFFTSSYILLAAFMNHLEPNYLADSSINLISGYVKCPTYRVKLPFFREFS